MLGTIVRLVGDLGYWGIGVLMAVENVVLPIPSELIMPFAGFECAVGRLTLAGTILTFILGMNAYATPVLLGGPQFTMMGPLVFGQFAQQNNWPFGGAISFVLMTATLLLTVVANLLVQRQYRR